MASEVHNLPYIEVIGKKTDNEADYLIRVHLTPMKWWPWDRYYVHFIGRPDKDRERHDHPWNFRTWVLWGGYDEEAHVIGADGKPTGETVKDTLGWLATRFRPATHAHRIVRLHTKTVVTLVKRSNGRVREWGFWTQAPEKSTGGFRWVWVKWTDYLGLPARTYEAY